MTYIENPSYMPEAEVSLQFAIALIEQGIAVATINVGIDGAQVRIQDKAIFSIEDYLLRKGWILEAPAAQRWQGVYASPEFAGRLIRIHSKPGLGDVTVTLKTGQRLIAESKKGPLERSSSSQEYRLLREALGQVLTTEQNTGKGTVPVAVVPDSEKFRELAARWRVAPLVAKAGIQIATIGRDGTIDGLSLEG